MSKHLIKVIEEHCRRCTPNANIIDIETLSEVSQLTQETVRGRVGLIGRSDGPYLEIYHIVQKYQ